MTDEQQQLIQSAAMLQQQLQIAMSKREAVGIQKLEIKKAIDELEASKQGDVYKIAGPIIIKTQRVSILKDLKGRDEELDVRLKSLEKEEKRIKLRIEELRERLSKHTQGAVGG
jgi:prefoldin beta subunit